MQDWIPRKTWPIIVVALAAATGCSKKEEASSAPSADMAAPAPAMAASAAPQSDVQTNQAELSVHAYPTPGRGDREGSPPSGEPGGVAGTPGIAPGPGASAPGNTGPTAGTAGVKMDEPHDKVE